jgi:hypothetical protein
MEMKTEAQHHAEIVEVADTLGRIRACAESLYSAQEKGVALLTRNWNAPHGRADAARRLHKPYTGAARMALAQANETIRLLDQLRDSMKAEPHYDRRISALEHREAPPPTSAGAES